MEDTNNKTIKEFNVPAPWGHIAVKTWGEEKLPAVLVIHGRSDNAGSFDGLLQLLPNCFYYICIDLPGHGRSSHFPPHLPLYTINNILVYRIIMKHFNRNSYIILGHSYGGHIGLLFAQLYPNLVEKLIMLETIHIFPHSIKDSKNYLVNAFEKHLQIEEKLVSGKKPTYTYEEALKKLQNGRETTPSTPSAPLTLKAATALMKRAIERNSDGTYSFTLDPRMKNFVDPFYDFRYVIENLRVHSVKCPILIVLGDDSMDQQIRLSPILKFLKTWKNVSVKHVPGNHDVHNSCPEVVAPHVKTFLLTNKSKI